MIQALRKLAIPIVALLSLGFILFLVNQVSGIYLMASDLNPLFGKIVLAILLILIAGLLISPFVIYFKLPKPLKPATNDRQLGMYKKRLLARLKSNKILIRESAAPKEIEDLPQAIAVLDTEADKILTSTAQTIFLTTAISQNGKLDAFTVFLTQVRMVWKIAHVYYQKPSPRELLYLYGNIGATAFLASEIEDIDLTKHIEPIITSIARNSGGRSVPVVGQATTIIMDSLLEGTTNCFLALRVGVLTKKYCGQLSISTKAEIRKSTLKEASAMLRKIAVSSSADFIGAILRATKNAGINTVKDGWDTVVKAGTKMKESVMEVSRKVNPF